ncbi:hypothetical protein SAMN02910317_01863 [Ruminococcaceae bacterium FB2012]|nr:hypothetical protein SAMN02910317_01863 [Ruminococcaceae bacterium FB2012]
MKMKITAAAVIAAAAIALAGCGSDGSSSKADTSSAAPAAQSQADTAASKAEESTAPAPAESKAEESQAAAPASSFTADNAVVKYNGAEVKVGQNIDDIKGSLGAEAAPVSQVPSCLSGNIINEYYFPGMTIQANNSGVIFSIELTNALYAGGDGTTADGLKVGDKVDDFKAKLGEPTETKGTSPVYTAGTVSMQASGSPSAIESIWISDSSIDN